MKILITGGAGFIGTNAAFTFASDGHDIVILDNLSRRGTEANLRWLKEHSPIAFVRGDLRHVDDLQAVFEEHSDIDVEHIDTVRGGVYNIGGGPEFTLSIWAEFKDLLQDLLGREIPVVYDNWRPGDQPIYISDISSAKADFGWQPAVDVRTGLARLFNWIRDNLDLFREVGLIENDRPCRQAEENQTF